MVNICLTFNFAGIKELLHINWRTSTKNQAESVWPESRQSKVEKAFRVEGKQKARKHDFKQWSGFLLVENVGQVIAQDGGSVDHGLSGSPSRFLV